MKYQPKLTCFPNNHATDSPAKLEHPHRSDADQAGACVCPLVCLSACSNHSVRSARGALHLAVGCSYFGVLLLHECGHLVAAQQKGCQVWSVELYPFWGITRYDEPYSQRDHCVIAWAGVVAQMIVAIPLVAWVERFGFTHHQTVNMVLSIFGFYSFFVAGFNLLPVVPLDGAVAWRLLPTLFRSHARRPAKREPGWRSWR